MIGIFDSGVGGLTVVRAINQSISNQSIIYFGDTARVPWGTKSKWAVRKYSQEISDFLLSQGVETIVIACNTASAVASRQLRMNNPKIKFFDVIDPCVERASELAKSRKSKSILVIGTGATIQSGVYEKKLKKSIPGIRIYSQACPLFVPLVEEGWINESLTQEVIEKYLKKFLSKNINQVILGCTHYPLLVGGIKKLFGGKIEIVSSADEVAKKIKEEIGSRLETDRKNQKDSFYFSDWSEHNEKLTKLILGKQPKIKIYRFNSK